MQLVVIIQRVKCERTFKVSIDEWAAESRIREYFAHSGYHLMESKPILKFKRGRKWAFWFTFNPSKIETIAKVMISKNPSELEVIADLQVETTGQIVTDEEKEFYENELVNLENTLMGKQYLVSLPSSMDVGKCIGNSQIKAQFIGGANTIIFVVVLFVIALILGIFVIEKFISNPDVAYITVITASLVITTVLFRVWNKWRERKTKE